MAVPTNLTANTLRLAQSGIVVGVTPSTGSPRFRIELQVSTQSSTASTAWQSAFLNPTTAQYQYTFLAPLSTRTFYFRARHLLDGYSNGPFTGTVSAKPGLLPIIVQPLMPLLNSKSNVEVLGGDIWLSSSKTAKVGTQQTTGTITKTLRINYGEFVPFSNLVSWVYSNNLGLSNNSIAAAQQLVAPLLLPPGVQMTNVRARLYRGTTTVSSTAKLEFVRVTDGADTTAAPSATIFKTLTHATKGYKTLSTGTTQIVNSTQSFNVLLTLRSTVLSGARLSWVEIDYKMGTYIKAI